jgi:prepilin-type N-terminal cleavage/methylation domain-containing protein
MKKRSMTGATPRELERGFSMIEISIVLAIAMIIAAISTPKFLTIYRGYQLNSAASQVASALKFSRYEAIRQNKAISFRITQTGTSPVVTRLWTDVNNNSVEEATETQTLFTGNVNLVASTVPPGTTSLAANVGVTTLTAVSISSGTVAFDQRGAIAPAAVNVLYIGNAAVPSLGYKAVVLLPSGSIQIWTTTNGTWGQIN